MRRKISLGNPCCLNQRAAHHMPRPTKWGRDTLEWITVSEDGPSLELTRQHCLVVLFNFYVTGAQIPIAVSKVGPRAVAWW